MAQDKTNQNVEKPLKSQIAEREEQILAFWNERGIFKKSLEKKASKGEFRFYDGPPFATGLPHYGHILPGTVKDVIPRFKTMQGYHVLRRWGWDTHGLPIENLIEKELGLKNKKDILDYGIEKFNRAAREKVFLYADEWKKIIPRTGRWVDMDNPYTTMDSSYTESVWWSFKTLFDKDLAYEGYRVMPYCPHCGTTLSNFEVNQGYKDITDISVYVKFELVDEPGTFLLAWTTTPWTLPGNTALAINPTISYVQIQIGEAKIILAEDRLSVVKDAYTVEKKFLGKELVGKQYKPIFNYYVEDFRIDGDKSSAWTVHAGDFVSTDTGSGIVHIAPAFGEDDYILSQKENIFFVQHVEQDGTFKKEVTDFVGQPVKPKGDHQKTDIEIIKYLAHNGALFAKEKLVHSYPHCWRCDTPLLNYATSSWFVKTTDVKEKLISENKKVNWVPAELRDGRFGNWLEGAKDWGVSRQRFWGSPLPVWRCAQCKQIEVLDSVESLRQKVKSPNVFFFMRHGEGEHNVKGILSTKITDPHHLTEKGRKLVEDSAEKLKGEAIDHIFASPFIRTKETATIVAEHIGYPVEKIIFDDRIREINTGVFDGKPVNEYHEWFKTPEERFTKAPEGGETTEQVRMRVGEFLLDIDKNYSGKNILIVSHDDPIFFMRSVSRGLTRKEILNLPANDADYLSVGQFKMHHHYRIPLNEKLELDLHRPYIDEISWKCDCGGTYKRIPDVFDTWYDSGSMPYASHHYPFEKEHFDPHAGLFHKSKSFPADFIAEGLDQTRGWFYVLMVLNTALFNHAPYKNVVVNGLILAEDGKKMSKSLKNYPELMPTIDKYGADALRFFLMSSPAVKAEDVRFSEAGLDEVVKKILLRLQNVYSFYELYAQNKEKSAKSTNVLDRWIIARLYMLGNHMTESLEKYEVDRATRPIEKFIDDLSTWYLRRSRERFKGDDAADKQAALHTLGFVFNELAKLLAPSMPFAAEDLYQKIKDVDAPESVHLESWPAFPKADEKIITDMEKARAVVEQSLALRAKAGLKVRQPLAKLSIAKTTLDTSKELLSIIADEVNIKEVVIETNLKEGITLDTTLTPELIEEGKLREIIRMIQEARKELKLNPQDVVSLNYKANDEGKRIIEKNSTEISKKANIHGTFVFVENLSEEIVLPDLQFAVKLTR